MFSLHLPVARFTPYFLPVKQCSSELCRLQVPTAKVAWESHARGAEHRIMIVQVFLHLGYDWITRSKKKKTNKQHADAFINSMRNHNSFFTKFFLISLTHGCNGKLMIPLPRESRNRKTPNIYEKRKRKSRHRIYRIKSSSVCLLDWKKDTQKRFFCTTIPKTRELCFLNIRAVVLPRG